MIDMRMTEDKLVGKAIADIGNIELALLASNPRIEADMEQHVAKLLADVMEVILLKGISKLINFLYGVGPERLIGLLAVPWTFGP